MPVRTALILIIILCNHSAGWASEKVLSVRLFSTEKGLTRLVLRGPFVVESGSSSVTIGGDTFCQLLPLSGRAGAYRLMPAGAKQGRILSLPLTLHAVSKNGTVACGPSANRLRRYKGRIFCSQGTGGILTVMNLVERFDYVASVVGSEMPAGFAGEALKAQAVLTQTRISKTDRLLQLKDSTEDECYKGQDAVRPDVLAAVAAVQGRILTYDRRPIRVYYHSTCGGGTSSSASLFGAGSQYDYLPAVRCNYCLQSPFYKMQEHMVPAKVFAKALGSAQVFVSERDVAERPVLVELSNGTRMSGYKFWLKLGGQLGWDKVPGTRFWIRQRNDQGVILVSRGCGHGVGLCQWGAQGLALAGTKYEAILNFFFPGTHLSDSKKAAAMK